MAKDGILTQQEHERIFIQPAKNLFSRVRTAVG